MFGKDIAFILYVCSLLRIFLKLLDNGGKTKEIVHQVADTVDPTVGCAASRKKLSPARHKHLTYLPGH